MAQYLRTREVNNFYVEFPTLIVKYEIFPAVYGKTEADSGGLYLGGAPRLPEQVDITNVYVQINKDLQIDILPSLPEEYVISLEDEILEGEREQ
jgi:hypothetical protein